MQMAEADCYSSMFRDTDWVMGTLLMCLKEIVAVLFQLLCYARMGNYDFFNGALILFATLTVFSFPFLNANLFTCLRLGPWYNRPGQNFGYNLGGTFIQIVCVIVFQFSGAILAAVAWHGILNKWGMLAKGVNNGVLYTNSNISGAVYNSIDGRVPEDNDSKAAIFADEFAAQAAFMVGVLHIIEAVLPGFLLSATYQKNQKSPEPQSHTPIPLHLILFICLLVAGMTRAFPSAHQSPHVSVYLLVLGRLGAPGIDVTACWLRIGGGVLALVFTLAYYWTVYGEASIWGSSQEATKAADTSSRPLPPFMRSLLVTPFRPQSYNLMRDRN
jgi:hypothetical protein